MWIVQSKPHTVLSIIGGAILSEFDRHLAAMIQELLKTSQVFGVRISSEPLWML